MNLVFVDFENVPHFDPALAADGSHHFTLLMGARQAKLDVVLVEKLMEHAASVKLVRMGSPGKNALDFTLAYYLGRAVEADPAGSFHILSRDKGFDPLIEHLRGRHIRVQRHDDFSAFGLKTPASCPAARTDAPFQRVVEHLRGNVSGRPKRRKTLASHLLAFCGKATTPAEVEKVLEALCQAGHVRVGERDAVTYHF